MKTPLRYPGGKSKVADMLCGLMPSFSKYREPFLGGGSIFLKTKESNPDANFWINDLYTDLYSFWSCMRDCPREVVDIILKWKSEYTEGKPLYAFLRESHTFDQIQTAAAFFVMNRITFSGTVSSGGYSNESFEKRFTESSVERLIGLSSELKDVKITNLDYSELLRAEGDDVFIFMDPPYYTATKSALYGPNGSLHRNFDHERFARTVKSCPHKWMITYDDCQYIRDLFRGYEITPFDIVYGMRNVTKGAVMHTNEIMITNYALPDIKATELF